MRTLVRPLLIFGLLVHTFVSYADEAPAVDEIKLKGKDEITLKRDGASWQLHGPGDARRTLRADGAAWVLVGGDKKIALRAEKRPDGVVRISDAKGALVHELKPTSEGFELSNPDHSLLLRVKLKADKVNVYDAKAQRIFHAKAKEDGYSIRDASDAEIWKVKGPSSLRQTSYFAIPLEIGEVALLWRASE